MPTAFILGGSGQIGLAVADRLTADGWEVTTASRRPPSLARPWRHVELDISQPGGIAAALPRGVDFLLSCIAFDASDARQLLQMQPLVGRIVAISSASVYRDAEGRTLDEAKDCGFPLFPEPLTVQNPTVSPGPETYSTRKVAMERELLTHASTPVTILRPCAIHGPHSKHAREWWFVKRLLDGRKRIPLAYGGGSRFQTTSVAAIAEAVARAANGKLPPIANVADADSPTVAEIGHTIMGSMGVDAELVGLPDEPYPPVFGATPWSVQRPMICAALATHNATYAQSVPPAIDWLIEATRDRDWRQVLPQLAAYPGNHFDYEADDRGLTMKGVRPLPR